MSNNTMGFKSFHPYSDILNLYGAQGRVLGIVRRLQRRGKEAIVEQITSGQPLHAAQYDLFIIGSGQNSGQGLLPGDLKGKKAALIKAATLVGFENHAGRTYLDAGVLCDFGNNGEDGSEGARRKNIFAAYAQGPVLPKDPTLCDLILKTAPEHRYGSAEPISLPDTIEKAEHDPMQRALKGRG